MHLLHFSVKIAGFLLSNQRKFPQSMTCKEIRGQPVTNSCAWCWILRHPLSQRGILFWQGTPLGALNKYFANAVKKLLRVGGVCSATNSSLQPTNHQDRRRSKHLNCDIVVHAAGSAGGGDSGWSATQTMTWGAETARQPTTTTHSTAPLQLIESTLNKDMQASWLMTPLSLQPSVAQGTIECMRS